MRGAGVLLVGAMLMGAACSGSGSSDEATASDSAADTTSQSTVGSSSSTGSESGDIGAVLAAGDTTESRSFDDVTAVDAAEAELSVVASMREANIAHFPVESADDTAKMSGRQKVVLVTFGLAFVVMVFGIIPWEDLGIGLPTLWWWFPEMTALFLLFGIIIGLIARLRESELVESFVDGASGMLGVALIIGIARGITVVMNNGGITDTVLHWAEEALGGVGEAGFAVVAFLLFLPLSFLIPSSSGLATVAMPIMAPLASFLGVPPETVVTAFQSASGIMNLFIPTSAVVMGGLAIARVPYGGFLRWVWPLLLILAGVVIIVLAVTAFVV